jgi:hypothetical protein
MLVRMRAWVFVARVVLVGGAAGALSAGCGSSIPKHTGYPEGKTSPWTSAKELTLDQRMEAQTRGDVNYANRHRARWYAVDLPSDGELTAVVTFDGDNPHTDLAVEIFDAGLNLRAEGRTDDDEGRPKKTRKVKDLAPGRAYVHVYTLNRTDSADFKVRLTFKPVYRPDPRKAFPNNVPSTPMLAAVPAVDDSPRRRGGRRRPPPPPDKPPPPKPEEPEIGAVRATIVEFSESTRGVKIVINKGQNAGIEAGWRGYIVDKSTKRAMPNGSFQVGKVKPDEAEALVKVSLTAVQNNRLVVVKPPK